MAHGTHNESGRPLAASDWLEAHHLAKLPERKAFAARLAQLRPLRVVDLGCATGLWLDLLNDLLPEECAFVGVDSDQTSLLIAQERAKGWTREVNFLDLDIETQLDQVPEADLTLAFNVFPYVDDLDGLLVGLACRPNHGVLAVRQYDGASIRFGPMETAARQAMDVSLRTAVESSRQFKHYDLDRVFEAISRSPYTVRSLEFEVFQRVAPFPSQFLGYYRGTLDWTERLLSVNAAAQLRQWRERTESENAPDCYFFEVDLVALLS